MSTLDLSQSASSANEMAIEFENINENLIVSSQQIGLEAQVVVPTNKEVPPKKGRKRKFTFWEYFIETTSTFKGVSTSL